MEFADDWKCELLRPRVKPSAFNVINVTQDMLMAYTTFLKPTFKATCSVKTRSIRKIYILYTQPHLFLHRDSWNGGFQSSVLIKPVCGAKRRTPVAELKQSYTEDICQSAKKSMQIFRFCLPSNYHLFDNLAHIEQIPPANDSDSTAGTYALNL